MDKVNTKRRRILIIEDDEDMRKIYEDMFKGRAGEYEIEMEGSAEESLKKIDKGNFDLIILDIIMEPMTGDDFFVHLRMEKKVEIPIIVVSVIKPDTLNSLQGLNHVSFLEKPITEEQLFRKIEEALR